MATANSQQSSDLVSQLLKLAASYCASGQLREAEAACQQALAVDPKNAQAFHTLGMISEVYFDRGKDQNAQGKLNEAAEQFEKTLALKPDHTEAYFHLGALRKLQGNGDEALKLYIKAVLVKPDYPIARFNLANSLRDEGHIYDALEQYVRALNLDPAFWAAHVNLGGIYKKLGKYDAAIMHYEQARSLKPEDTTVMGDLIHLQQHICAWDGLADREALLLDMVRQERKGISPFSILGIPSTPADQLTAARTLGHDKEQDPASLFRHKPGKSRERIRIGYLSADFHEHATAYLMAELFARHDRQRFKITAYSYGPEDNSSMRQRLVRAFDHFIDLRNLSDHAAAQKIHDDGIDILIDLKGGYTEDARPGIAAWRPAPIQVNYIGYPGTMGVSFIDYIIADRFIIPESFEKFYSEKVVCLPDSYQPNDTAREIAEETPTRAECGLPEQAFVFCSFNNTYKITPVIFDIWMRLLQAVPDSVLWLFEANTFAKDNLQREAVRRGVSADRLVFAPRLPLPQHLARHRLADLFLDTLPVNAHTTASDALWAGLPVLTCAGKTFASRVAGSLLTAVRLPELITYSPQAYEALALQLAHDPVKLRSIRQKIEQARAQIPLFDIDRFTKNIESAYQTMFNIWKDGEAPRAFSIHNNLGERMKENIAQQGQPRTVQSRITYESCPLCSSKKMEVIKQANCSKHPLYNGVISPIITWKKCLLCAHVFTEGYFTDEAAAIIFSKTNEEQKVGYDLDRQRIISSKMVEKILPFVQEGKWLDVGFGNGALLFTAKEYGFIPVGIDLRRENVGVLQKLGIEAHCIDLQKLDMPKEFSVISMADVLEHVPYPKSFLKSIHNLLKDNGVLFISMPNTDSVLWNILDMENVNFYWEELEHFHNFSKNRLYDLLKEVGFEPLRYGISERYKMCMEVVAKKN